MSLNNCLFRTTNGPESFHRIYNGQFYSVNPPISVVISVLINIQTKIVTKINSKYCQR